MESLTHPPGSTAPWQLLAGYQPRGHVHDELVAPGGELRPHYDTFVRSLEALGRHELASRWENAKRTIRDNGVTYNVYGDPEGVDRPWTLDMIPLVVPSSEWSRLEAALVQRARLLNSILADLYGPQRLLHERHMPAPLVFGNPGFLRSCHGIAVPRGIHLHLHAVDLARSPDGQWWVLADRTQAPSGAGYTLENRIVLSRSLPEAFRDCQVQRLASFFWAQRDTLTALAPSPRDTPRVVLLTPGPLNETYFEHAYLARYLGFTLVEGGDLTVRDRRVFIKTLDGLQPVDVIVRRLDDSYCDPLELRADSTLGIAGLVDAARAGNVTMANALGSGAIETAAISRFLPGLCRTLLGEELRLPSVPTRWCGEPGDLQIVIEHLDQMVIKRTFPPVSGQPIFGRTLTPLQRAALVSEIRAHPGEFVGQDEVPLSTAPVWNGQKLESRSLVLRMYVAAAGDSYAVMPGGLTRIAVSGEVPIVSMQRGGGSKDTWVLTDGPVSPMSLLAPPTIRIHRERRSGDLPSRVADNLFWLGRYAERVEHSVRLLRSVVARLADEDASDVTPERTALVRVLVALELLPAGLRDPLSARDVEQELLASLFRPGPGSRMRETLEDLRRIASTVRDRLSIDTWRILNQLRQDFLLRRGRIQVDDALLHLDRMITDLAAFSGMEMENMTRGHGWRFLDIGRRLERAANMSTLLTQSLSTATAHHAMLGPLLEIADSTMTYRRRYFAQPQLPLVLDLLVADATNARSMAFQVAQLADHVDHLPRDQRAPSPAQEQQIVTHMAEAIASADLDAQGQPDEHGSFAELHGLLLTISDDLRRLSDVVTYYYFSHAEVRVS
ncbi:MAG TPA: circularly permuted type 2 ATP-grasp protein [Vicinamibacterales bacterium]|nr:circularly permuted type 2 ATP-grasp protein [Vicinamibacterales bacterium]